MAEKCKLCPETKKGDDRRPETLEPLSQKTINKQLTVHVCPFCDGGTLEYARKHTS